MNQDWPEEIFPDIGETCAGKFVTFYLIFPFFIFYRVSGRLIGDCLATPLIEHDCGQPHASAS